MASKSLVSRLKTDFPTLRFEKGNDFYWSPKEQTVFYQPVVTRDDALTLLHEVGHALLKHSSYMKDIELPKLERDAWNRAKKLANTYGYKIDEEYIETALDTYRDWLHARSLCPDCLQTGIQTDRGTYQCLVCSLSWKVNDARQKALKRRRLTL